jgi:hypothetical protein
MTGPEATSRELVTRASAPGRPTPTTLDATSVVVRSGPDQARTHLAAAASALDGWCSRRTDPGHTYVQDGHDAIRDLDAAVRVLHHIRSMLVGQIRTDEDERALRVERLHAGLRAERMARTADPPNPDAPSRGGTAG